MDSGTISLSYALEFCMGVPALVMALAPVRNHLRLGRRETYALAIAYVVMLAGSGAILSRRLYLPSAAVLVPGALLLFLPYAQAVKLTMAKRVFCFANAMMLCSFATLYAVVIMSPWEKDSTAIVSLPQTGAMALVVAVVLYLVFNKTLLVKLPALLNHDEINDVWRWFALIPIALAALMRWMIPWDISLMVLGRARAIMLVMAAFIPAVEWLLYHLAWNVMTRVWKEGQLRQEVTLLRAEERRYNELRSYMDESRAFRHDYRHHLLAMRGMLEANKIKELAEYLEQLSEREAEGQRPQLCRNLAVDSVAAYYDAIAKEKRVNMSWFLDLPEHLPVAEVDLCSILGNLVENAITASSKLDEPKRWVEVVSQEVTDHALGFNVRNSYAGEVQFGRDGLPKPKMRRQDHGIGLSSVVSIAHRYNGGFDARVQDGEFFAGVILYHE